MHPWRDQDTTRQVLASQSAPPQELTGPGRAINWNASSHDTRYVIRLKVIYSRRGKTPCWEVAVSHRVVDPPTGVEGAESQKILEAVTLEIRM